MAEFFPETLFPFGHSGTPWPRGFRARFRETGPGEGDLFVCSEPFMLQYRWTRGATVDLDEIEYLGHWQGDYEKEIQDSRLFDFSTLGGGPKALVVKNSEAFAIVEPAVPGP